MTGTISSRAAAPPEFLAPWDRRGFARVVVLALAVGLAAARTQAEEERDGSEEPHRWVSVSGSLDGGYRQTFFFEPNHKAYVAQLDLRLELWLPAGGSHLSWGPFLRAAGIASNRDEAWENAALAAPGLGIHLFPLSFSSLQGSAAGRWLGPLRLFAEVNRLGFKGKENEWRPSRQVRWGADYWKAIAVNEPDRRLWAEIWTGLFWQSSNEFDESYDSAVLGNSVRVGARPKGSLAALSLYGALESSSTKHETYYWENRLLVGSGLRFAPRLRSRSHRGLNRLAIFVEYLAVARYYRVEAPEKTPDWDARAGFSVSFGSWYR